MTITGLRGFGLVGLMEEPPTLEDILLQSAIGDLESQHPILKSPAVTRWLNEVISIIRTDQARRAGKHIPFGRGSYEPFPEIPAELKDEEKVELTEILETLKKRLDYGGKQWRFVN